MGINIAIAAYRMPPVEEWTRAGHHVTVIPAPGEADAVDAAAALGER